MNIEGFFVRTTSVVALRKIVEARINSADDLPGFQPDWGLEPSYDVLITGNPKRKVVISKPKSGWIAAIESKEVVDFALLQQIAISLATAVVAYQLSESTGGCGYAVFSNGKVERSQFDAESEDPLADTRNYIAESGIPFELVTFREAVQDKTGNWELIQKTA